MLTTSIDDDTIVDVAEPTENNPSDMGSTSASLPFIKKTESRIVPEVREQYYNPDTELRSLLHKRGSLPMRLEKIMIVGADIPQSLNDVLRSSGRNVTHVRDGKRAVLHAEHEIFDVAILHLDGRRNGSRRDGFQFE